MINFITIVGKYEQIWESHNMYESRVMGNVLQITVTALLGNVLGTKSGMLSLRELNGKLVRLGIPF